MSYLLHHIRLLLNLLNFNIVYKLLSPILYSKFFARVNSCSAVYFPSMTTAGAADVILAGAAYDRRHLNFFNFHQSDFQSEVDFRFDGPKSGPVLS